MRVPLSLNAVKAAVQNKPKAAATATEQKNDTAVDVTPATNKGFGRQELQKAWSSFFIELKSSGSPIELLLATASLQLGEGYAVTAFLNSSVQEEPFERLKPRLQQYLRQQLQTGQLSLTHQFAEESGPRKLYTNSEKFQHLLERYPLLGELKEKLGLEADF